MQLDDMAVVKKRRKKRVQDPTRSKHLPFVYVVWVWSDTVQRWFLLAFYRGGDRLTVKRIRKFRDKFSLPADVTLRFRELFSAVAAPGDESDPTLMHALKRHLDRSRYNPDPHASRTETFRPRPFPKRRPIEGAKA